MLNTGRMTVGRMKTSSLKTICFTLAVILCLWVLSACSGVEESGQSHSSNEIGSNSENGQNREDPGNAAGSGAYDIFSDKEQIIDVEEKDLKGILKSTQFYHGEPVMLSAQHNDSVDIWLHSPGEEAWLVVQGLPPEVVRGAGFGFLDEEGCYYHIRGGTVTSADATITKYDESGEKAFAIDRNAASLQMCSLADRKIALFYRDSTTGNNVLELLDTATGAVSEVKLNGTTEYNVYLGTDGTVPYLLDSYGVSRVDPENGEITRKISFRGSSYGLDLGASERENGSISSFRVQESGDVEILWGRMYTIGFSASLGVSPGTVWLETLQRREIGGDKTFLTIRGLWELDDWLKEKIVEFNSRSSDYYVLVEICEDGVSDEDYINRTLVELGTGKGPDILYGNHILGDSLYSLIEKGAFEDLAPYMERSGMKQDDYFPMTFCRDPNEGKVYGIHTEADVYTQIVDSSLLGGADSVDIDTFLDALLTLGDKAVYRGYTDSAGLLQAFLEGSENLWGMVDWESGTCDFDTELFAKLLRAAGNLGDSDRKNYTPVSKREHVGFGIQHLRNQEREGKMLLGMLFDDGCHGMVNTWFGLKVNANSPNKEGAWEFLSYLLSREVQVTQFLPAHRGAFSARAEEIMAEHARGGLSVYPDPLTKEEVAELETYLMEDVRFPSVRIQPLIDIIIEEAADYFGGIKDIDQVRAVVKNRVQLYLDERS